MSLTFRHIALIGKHHSAFNSAPPAQARQVLTSLTLWLKHLGAEVFLEKDSAQQIGLDVAPTLDVQTIASRCDLALVVGGDGTMLGFGRQLAPHGVPLIGINQGRLGFITDIALDQLEAKLEPMLNGDYEEDHRVMLQAQVWRGNILPQTAAQLIVTDNHSPGPYRTIGAPVNMDAWYKAFDVKPGDKLYKKPEDRIRIW